MIKNKLESFFEDGKKFLICYNELIISLDMQSLKKTPIIRLQKAWDNVFCLKWDKNSTMFETMWYLMFFPFYILSLFLVGCFFLQKSLLKILFWKNFIV